MCFIADIIAQALAQSGWISQRRGVGSVVVERQEQEVRVPQDVRVVSLVNKGLRWLWPRPLARLEMDAQASGKTIAKAISDYLHTGRRIDVQTGTVWREGESF